MIVQVFEFQERKEYTVTCLHASTNAHVRIWIENVVTTADVRLEMNIDMDMDVVMDMDIYMYIFVHLYVYIYM